MAAPQFKNPVVRWIDYRLPIFTQLNHEYNEYPMPKNCNYLWSFGAIAMVVLIIDDRVRHHPGDELHAAYRLWPSIRSSASCATSISAG